MPFTSDPFDFCPEVSKWRVKVKCAIRRSRVVLDDDEMEDEEMGAIQRAREGLLCVF